MKLDISCRAFTVFKAKANNKKQKVACQLINRKFETGVRAGCTAGASF